VPVEKKVLAAFGCAALVLIVAAVTYSNVRSVREVETWVGHTHEVIATLLSMQADARGAEAEQRGYLLTGASAYTLEYGESVERLEKSIERVRSLTLDSDAQQVRLRALGQAVRERIALLDGAIRIRDAGGLEATARFIAGESANRSTDQLLGLTTTMIDAEYSLLSNRQAALDRELTWTAFIVAGGSLLACLLVIVLNQGIRVDLIEHGRRAQELQQTLAQRNRVLEELEARNRDLDQFAYVASHDLKAPLRGIANLSEWVEEDLAEAMTEKAKEQMALLRGRVHRMEALIDGILAYSRAGRGVEKTETVDVSLLLREIVDVFAVPNDKATFRLGARLPTLRTERIPLQQILMNLVGNAVKHNPNDGGEIAVEARDLGHAWEFSVLDNGPGVPAEYHERIFGIFQKLDSRDKVEGAGIGLAIVRKLVLRRGGKVWVDSSPSGGAAFRFTWPNTSTAVALALHQAASTDAEMT
jgi:signal transduction histidine kinase